MTGINLRIPTKEERQKAKIDREARISEFVSKNPNGLGSHLSRVPKLYQNLFMEIFNGKHRGLKAIKGKCLDCSCFQKEEIKNCKVFQCPLWNIRPFQD